MGDSLAIAVEFIVVTLFALAVVTVSIADMVRSRTRDHARWAMSVTIMLGSLGLLVQIPAVYHGLDRAVGVPNLAVLVYFSSYTLCAAGMHLWISTWPSTTVAVLPGIPRTRTIVSVIIGSVVVLSVLFAIGGHPREEPDGSFATYAHDWATRAMVFVYAAAYGGLWVWAAVRVHRVRVGSSAGGIRWLGSGLMLLEISMISTTTYALAFAVVASTVPGPGGARWMVGVDCVNAFSAMTACLGFSCRIWGPQLERLFGGPDERQVARMQYRQLRPLHRLAGAGAPVTMRRGLGLRRRDPGTALTYQVCAIIEGRKQLAGYRDERIEAVAAEWGRVLADAIRLSAAVRVHGSADSAAPSSRATHSLDLRSEIERSLRLSKALTMVQTLHSTGEFGRFIAPAGLPVASELVATAPASGIVSPKIHNSTS